MMVKATIPAVLMLTALAGASAYAATQGGTTTPEASLQKSAMPPAANAPAPSHRVEERMRSRPRLDEFSDA